VGHNCRRFTEKMAVFFIVTKTDDEPGCAGEGCPPGGSVGLPSPLSEVVIYQK
jgi:hypothetical protein